MPASIAELLQDAATRLQATSATPRLDAELLLAHTLGWPRARVLAERRHLPSPEQAAAFAALVARRERGEPVAYLVGHKEFYGLDLEVTPATLIPRPETEVLVELALIEARRLLQTQSDAAGWPGLTIADIGTGSGAIAIALATHLPQALVYAVDISPEALAVAERNVARHRLRERVRLLQGDLLAPLPEPVDLIVSNPPYTVYAEIAPEVRAYEPRLALDGGPNGVAVYRRLLAMAPAALRPHGALLLEIGAWQGQAVADLVRTALPGAEVRVHQDLAGRDRVVVARPSGNPVAEQSVRV
ncbi:MAG: peptide chain release factor N(5)-glutamine methyltransferase [Oscillochloridaceae bacterium]|nr:peptide chain release factor N(5)-glutamine methyltransferase [Chloroflexaceae bacterium]MDW8391853.1 peptide chain release factor N(5)-glutamine methyltransferase [Oscillochloridaceae bacterium]